MTNAEYARLWRLRNADKIKAYRKANAERMRRQTDAWQKRNPEKIKAYRRKNTAKMAEYLREYRRRNRDALRQRKHKRAKVWNASNWHKVACWKFLNKAVAAGELSRPDACSACGKKCTPQGHHSDYSEPLNVVWLCCTCHAAIPR